MKRKTQVERLSDQICAMRNRAFRRDYNMQSSLSEREALAALVSRLSALLK